MKRLKLDKHFRWKFKTLLKNLQRTFMLGYIFSIQNTGRRNVISLLSISKRQQHLVEGRRCESDYEGRERNLRGRESLVSLLFWWEAKKRTLVVRWKTLHVREDDSRLSQDNLCPVVPILTSHCGSLKFHCREKKRW